MIKFTLLNIRRPLCVLSFRKLQAREQLDFATVTLNLLFLHIYLIVILARWYYSNASLAKQLISRVMVKNGNWSFVYLFACLSVIILTDIWFDCHCTFGPMQVRSKWLYSSNVKVDCESCYGAFCSAHVFHICFDRMPLQFCSGYLFVVLIVRIISSTCVWTIKQQLLLFP